MTTVPDRKLHVSLASFAKIVLLSLGLVLLYYIRNLALLLFLTYVLASGLNPIVTWLQERTKAARTVAILVVVGTVFTVIAGLLFVALQSLIGQTVTLIDQLPSLTQDLVDRLNLGNYLDLNSQEDIVQKIQNVLGSPTTNGAIQSQVLSLTSNLFSGILTLITLAAITFYQLSAPEKIKNFVVNIARPKDRPKAHEIMDRVERQLGQWLIGQMSLVIGLGIFSYIGFRLFGIPFALPLAILAGASDIVPVIGPVVAFIPLIIVALATLPLPLAIGVILYFLVIQQIEGNFFVPKVMERTVGLDAIVVIVAIMVGSQILGILGALLAIPISVILVILYNEWQRHRE